MSKLEKALSTSELAKILNVSQHTVGILLRKEKIKGFRLTTRWRVEKKELERFIKDQEKGE